jgi:CRISPR/Cas system CMR subunit Cmr6 (Cas7 group RAMP superfamily)
MSMTPPPDPDADGPRPAGFLQVMGAVFWSFFGVRKRASGERDEVSIRPVHVILAGLLGAALLVAAVATLVHFIAHSA